MVNRVSSAVMPVQQVLVETISSIKSLDWKLVCYKLSIRFSNASAFLLTLIRNVISILVVLSLKNLLMLFSSFN